MGAGERHQKCQMKVRFRSVICFCVWGVRKLFADTAAPDPLFYFPFVYAVVCLILHVSSFRQRMRELLQICCFFNDCAGRRIGDIFL